MTAVKKLLFNRLQEIKESSTGRNIAIQIIYFFCGTLISRGAMFGELSPFGAAFVSAVPYRYLITSILGSILGYIVLTPVGSFRYIAIVVAIGAIRFVANDIKMQVIDLETLPHVEKFNTVTKTLNPLFVFK